jgi:hypothetical protein
VSELYDRWNICEGGDLLLSLSVWTAFFTAFRSTITSAYFQTIWAAEFATVVSAYWPTNDPADIPAVIFSFYSTNRTALYST